jgi:hypothetical protein
MRADRNGLRIINTFYAVGLDLGPTQPPVQWVAGALFPIKLLEREAHHCPLPGTEVKNA